jgi:hypothetical protein
MESTTARKYALAGGLLYLATFVFSIPTLGMKAPLDNADFVLGAGSATSVSWASLFDFVTAVAGIGTAVALYPVIRRFSGASAIGFVTTRTLEAAILVVGAMSLLSVITLRDAGTGDTASLLTSGQSLIALHDWSFLFGPGFMAVFNAVFLATAMYRFRLVPRIIPLIGLIGAPLLFASDIGVLFGMHEQVSSSAMLATLPIAAWEFSLGVYLTVKGFKRPVDVVDAPAASPALAA